MEQYGGLRRSGAPVVSENFWSMQSERLEVWSEKGTVRGTLGPVLDEFAVTFRVMHGFSSATVIKNVADETGDLDCPLRVLYVGDHDPSGMCMSERDLPERLDRYGANVDLIRTALMMPEDEDLPSFEAATKRGDPNYRWYVSHYGQSCWEVDALSPPILRAGFARRLNALSTWKHGTSARRSKKSSERACNRSPVSSDLL